MKDVLGHGLVALLLGAGLLLAVLGCLGLMDQAAVALAVAGGFTVVLSLCSMRKITRWIAAAVLPAGMLAWVFLFGGLEVLKEMAMAALLHWSGATAALSMLAQETALAMAVVIGAAAFYLTDRSQGSYPALSVVVLAALMLWLTDQPQLLWHLAPAAAGVLGQTILSRHEGVAWSRALPLAAAIAAVSFLIVPTEGVTVQPLKDFADDVRDKIFDYFFYTDPRNVFSLAGEGYYPQGQTQLGGPAEPTDHPVMQVKTPRRTYLRGSIKNEYTGRMWVDTIGGKRYVWVYPQWKDVRTAVFNMDMPAGALGANDGLMQEETVSVRMLGANASSMFVPQRIRSLSAGGDLVPYFSDSSEVFATRDQQEGDTYTVTAPLMLGGDAGLGTLVTACAANEDPYYQQMQQDYTTLPDHLQEQVFDLARDIVAGHETPYDKALALKTYLNRNFRYTLQVAPQPENIDFVSNFLLNTKEGYCTYYASAMTVLCRMVGLPARYVEGYLAEPDDQGRAYVTGLNGHAWTEVYFEGFGWLTFDATPSQHSENQRETPPEMQEPEPSPEPEEEEEPEEEPSPEPSPEPEDEPEPTPQPPDAEDEPLPDDPPNMAWLWWLLVVALIAGATARIIWMLPANCAKRATDEMGRWSAWMQAVYDGLRVMKLGREASESPMQHMRRVDGLHRIPADMTPLGECMALVFYGHMDPEPEETAMAAQAYARLMTQLAWWQKAQLMAVRAFLPEKKRSFTR